MSDRWTIYVEGHMLKGLPVMPVAEHEDALTVGDEMVERARLAGERWFAEHPNGASLDDEWREHYRAVLEASLCDSQSADRETPSRGQSAT